MDSLDQPFSQFSTTMSADMELQRPPSPPWSMQQPSKQWSIIEIKNGVEVAEYDLTMKNKFLKNYPNSKMVLFGRADDVVDIVLQHDSISRFHARIAFDRENETPWLRDLSSTHGVFVNNQRLPVKTIGREETMSNTAGSRGVIIYPDDIIQFGASSRYFCVVGPAEFSRSISGSRKPTASQLNENAEISSENDAVESALKLVDNDEYCDEPEVFLCDEKIPDHLRSEWEKIKTLQYKVENIETESERIQVKGDVDALSTGQLKQLERNNERVEALKDQIHTREAELHQKISPNNNNNNDKHRKSDKTIEDPDEEVDTYFDRAGTKQNRVVEFNENGETIATLMIKWDDKKKTQSEIESKLTILGEREIRLEQQRDESNADDDIFFVENDLNLVRETQQKLKQEKLHLLKYLDDVEEMIHVANPKLRKSNDGTSWSDSVAMNENINSMESHSIESPFEISTHPTKDGAAAVSSDQVKEKLSQQSMMAPPPKRQKSLKVSGIVSTMAVLTAANDSATQKHKEELRKTHEGKMIPIVRKVNSETAMSSDQHDIWQIPKDQDGSGITKLNAKFAGRY